ncbi:TMEM165/GDT1 family protein [Croceicoccus hydrothermalis]|uniref:TMEM165/GDT1 family protein n=1 Tax=Croceicoccus hydrothermalis TaxID=2867964 RepID=UPI001EFBB63B|nr:TMEM165/GDT1 family protein [Croceicoccus hydrothermalis]
MDAFLTSTLVVALAEIGDKTMLLAIVLATRFRWPFAIAAGIFLATIANHFLAALLGATAAAWLDSEWFRYLVAAGFVAMGLWTLVPDTFDEDDEPRSRGGAFVTTLIAFFLVEMGDKTQIATIALGAQFASTEWVTAGTTLGMMIANLPAIWLGDALVRRVSMKVVRTIAAALFLAIGIWLLVQTAGWLP